MISFQRRNKQRSLKTLLKILAFILGFNLPLWTAWAWSGKVCGVTNPSKVTGVSQANIRYVNTIATSIKANGEACSAGGECASGNCVDGYCCNTVCNTDCKSCNIGGSLGTCSNDADTTACSVGHCFSAVCKRDCDLPWGGTIMHNQSVLAYMNDSPACGDVCTSFNRVCTNGSLSGWYPYQSCTVQTCYASCSGTEGTGCSGQGDSGSGDSTYVGSWAACQAWCQSYLQGQINCCDWYIDTNGRCYAQHTGTTGSYGGFIGGACN